MVFPLLFFAVPAELRNWLHTVMNRTKQVRIKGKKQLRKNFLQYIT